MNVDIINKQYIFNVNIDSNGNQTVNADIVSKQLIVSVDVFKGGKGDKGDKGDKGEDGKDGTNGVDGTDGQNGQDLTLSDFSVAPEATTLNDTDKFLIEQGGVWKQALLGDIRSKYTVFNLPHFQVGSSNVNLWMKHLYYMNNIT